MQLVRPIVARREGREEGIVVEPGGRVTSMRPAFVPALPLAEAPALPLVEAPHGSGHVIVMTPRAGYPNLVAMLWPWRNGS